MSTSGRVVPGRCVACGSTRIFRAESLPVEEIAEHWAAACVHGPKTSPEEVREYVRTDLGERVVDVWACRDCQMEFALPARSWSAEHYPHEVHAMGFDHDEALRYLSGAPRRRVLDIGCADGQFLEAAARLGHDTVGLDFSAEDVESCRRRGLAAHLGDVRALAELTGETKFDVVTMFQVIEHLADPDGVFEDIAAVTAPDAVILIGCPSPRRYTRAFRHTQSVGRSDFWDAPPLHLLRWTPEALRAFLHRHGWSLTASTYEPMAPLGAAAHMAALTGEGSSWYRHPIARRAGTLLWIARLAVSGRRHGTTGGRLFVQARRSVPV